MLSVTLPPCLLASCRHVLGFALVFGFWRLQYIEFARSANSDSPPKSCVLLLSRYGSSFRTGEPPNWNVCVLYPHQQWKCSYFYAQTETRHHPCWTSPNHHLWPRAIEIHSAKRLKSQWTKEEADGQQKHQNTQLQNCTNLRTRTLHNFQSPFNPTCPTPLAKPMESSGWTSGCPVQSSYLFVAARWCSCLARSYCSTLATRRLG